MKIVIIDHGPLDYTANTVVTQPLGGTESSVVYLTNELGKNHKIFILNKTKKEEVFENVSYLPYDKYSFNEKWWNETKADVIINLTNPHRTSLWKKFSPKSKIIVWVHLSAQQPATHPIGDLSEMADVDLVVGVSEWHMNNLKVNFKLPDNKVTYVKNGLSKNFENLFNGPEDLLNKKEIKTCYTSAPYRGFHLLSHMIPYFRNELKFDIFSSMKLYQSPEPIEDERHFLFAKSFKGVSVNGVIPQQELAHRVSESILWTYPCLIEETFCLSALEAQAAGCRIVATDMGAIKSTVREVGSFIPLGGLGEEFFFNFINLIKKEIEIYKKDPIAWSEAQYEQVQYVNRFELWRHRVSDWEGILTRITNV